MKKLYLIPLLAALPLAAAAAPAEAVYDPDVAIYRVSPNGQWAMGWNYVFSSMGIFNLATGESYELYDNDEYYEYGYGTSIADDGTTLVNVHTENAGGEATSAYAAYWRDGQLTPLKGGSWTLAISPNGKYIVGLNAGENPAIWERDDDTGEYGAPRTLPQPRLDAFGKTPQWTHPMGVNDDASVVAMMTCPYTGLIDSNQPGICRKKADGSYEYVCTSEKAITTTLVRPTPPDYYSLAPDILDYFPTPEAAAEWLALYEAWDGSYGGWPDPVALGYMTAEEWAAYEAAEAEALAEYDRLDKIYLAEESAYDLGTRDMAYFAPHDLVLSPSGRYMASTSQKQVPGDDGEYYSYNQVFIFDTADNSWMTVNVTNLSDPRAISLTDVRGLTITSPMLDQVQNTYVSPYAYAPVQPIQDYMKATNPEIYAFMEEYMRHPVSDIFIEYDDPFEEIWLTGDIRCDNTMSVFAGYVWNLFSEYVDPESGIDYGGNTTFISYIMKCAPAGIDEVARPEALDTEAVYYNLNGVRVTRPAAGVYIKLLGGKASKVLL